MTVPFKNWTQTIKQKEKQSSKESSGILEKSHHSTELQQKVGINSEKLTKTKI